MPLCIEGVTGVGDVSEMRLSIIMSTGVSRPKFSEGTPREPQPARREEDCTSSDLLAESCAFAPIIR